MSTLNLLADFDHCYFFVVSCGGIRFSLVFLFVLIHWWTDRGPGTVGCRWYDNENQKEERRGEVMGNGTWKLHTPAQCDYCYYYTMIGGEAAEPPSP